MNDHGHDSGQRPQPHTGTNALQPAPPHSGDARSGNAPFCRVITAAASIYIPEADAEAGFAVLKSALPARSARRMSRLGLMLSDLIGQVGIDAETCVIYGSVFGEGRTLESYLSSFPQPSPLGFQSSIHPGGVEQALIFRQQPVREFFPVTASEELPLAMLRTLEQCGGAKRVLLLGGEERASWLTQNELAAGDNFAFALLLEPPQTNAPQLGQLYTDALPYEAEQSEPGMNAAPAHETGADTRACETDTANHQPPQNQPTVSGQTLADLCAAIRERRPLRLSHPDEGCWQLDWHR